MRNQFARSAEAFSVLVLCGLAAASCGGFVTTDGTDPGEEAPAKAISPGATPDDLQGGSDEEGAPAGPATTSIAPWSVRFGEESWQESKAIAVDDAGNVALAGRFSGYLDFGQGPLPPPPFGMPDDAFVAKLDAHGTPIWSRTLGGHQAEALAVAVEKDGSVVVTGYFFGTIDAGGGPLTSDEDDDIFVAKFDALGSHLWSKRFGGQSHQGGTDVAIDASSNVIITGYDWAGIDFGGGPLGGTYGNKAIIVKLDPGGKHVWSRRFGGLGSAGSSGKGVAVDGNGDIVVTGMASGHVDCGGGSLPATEGEGMFLAKLDAAGNHLWSRLLDGEALWGSHRVAVDSADNVVVFGSFYGVADLGGGPQPAQGNADAFLAKYDPSGVYLWSTTFGAAPHGYTRGNGVAIDRDNNLRLTGSFTGQVDFGGGPLVNGDADDIFVAKLDPSGKHLESQSYGGAELQKAWGIGVDATGAAVITGYFMNTVDFGTGPLTAVDAADIFVARLTP